MSDDALIDCLGTINQEAGGVLSVFVIGPVEILALLADEMAARLVGCVADTLDQVRSATRHKPFRCASCRRPVRGAAHWVVLAMGQVATPHHAVGQAICACCGKIRGQAEERALTAMRRVWPDLRRVRITHRDGGRA